MKNALLKLAALALLASPLAAQNLRVATVDMSSLLARYYKTAEANDKIRTSQETAQREAERMAEEGRAMLAELEDLRERAQNPALTEAARGELETTFGERARVVQEKDQELRRYLQDAQRSLQQRILQHRQLLLDEIKGEVSDLARERGFQLVLDTSPNGGADGIPAVVFSDASFDITEAALTRINRDAPPGFVPPAPGAPALDAAPAAAPAARPGAAPRR